VPSRPRAAERARARERVESLFGTNVLFGEGGQTRRVLDLPLEAVHADGKQPRHHFDEVSLDELASSIREHGLLQPVLVRASGEGRYALVAGERRLRACRTLGLERIPAILTDGDPEHVALVENLQRQDLAPLEEAEALERLRDRHAYGLEELAGVVGKSPTLLSEVLSLCSLPEPIKTELRTAGSRYSRSALVELARVRDSSRQQSAWETLKSGGTVRNLRSFRSGRQGHTPAARAKGQLLRSLGRFSLALEAAVAAGVRPTERELERLHAFRAALDETLAAWTTSRAEGRASTPVICSDRSGPER
jgi:ParB family transcriptional regulator, chromosome partitioning protein